MDTGGSGAATGGSGAATGPGIGAFCPFGPVGPVGPVAPVSPLAPVGPAFAFSIADCAPPLESYLPAFCAKHFCLSSGLVTPSSYNIVSISAIILFSFVRNARGVPVLAMLFRIRARFKQRILRTKSGRGVVRLPTTQFRKSRI